MLWVLLVEWELRHKCHSSDKYLHYRNVAIIDTSRRDRELDTNQPLIGNTIMSNTQSVHSQENIEKEANANTKAEADRVVFIGIGAVVLAFTVFSIFSAVTGVTISLGMLVAAIAPVALFVILRATYIQTIKRDLIVAQLLKNTEGME